MKTIFALVLLAVIVSLVKSGCSPQWFDCFKNEEHVGSICADTCYVESVERWSPVECLACNEINYVQKCRDEIHDTAITTAHMKTPKDGSHPICNHTEEIETKSNTKNDSLVNNYYKISIDDVVDKAVLNFTTKYLKKNDPFLFPDLNFPISKKVGWVTVNGGANITQIKIKGISTFHRALPTFINSAKNKIEFHFSLDDDVLKGQGNILLYFMKVSTQFKTTIRVKNIYFIGKATYNPAFGTFKLNSFDVERIGKINVNLDTSSTIINQVSSIVINKIVNAMEPDIKAKVNEMMTASFASFVDKMKWKP